MSTFQGSTGGKRSRENYQVVVQEEKQAPRFHYKGDALAYAKVKVKKERKKTHIECRRTGQITYVLQYQQTSCTICGNELEGKQHCPLCGRLHAYV